MTGRVGMLHRARLALVAATVLSFAILVTQLPLSTLVHQRGQLAAASAQLSAVRSENAHLSRQIAALHEPATIAAIAHAQYGLVQPGQIEYEIPHLPGGATGTCSLATPAVPHDLLVPPTPSPLGPVTATSAGSPASHQGFWAQVVGRLAFWRGTF